MPATTRAPQPPNPEITGIETRVMRGHRVESRHVAVAAWIPRHGSSRLFGSSDPGTFLRSVAKPFQALALFETGVVEAFSLSDEEIAVVAASHAGESYHHELSASLLERGGYRLEDLQCGVHAPFSVSERIARVRSGAPFSVLGNNCSGKHAGMLLHARHIGADPRHYLDPDHPVQAAVRSILERFTGEPLAPERGGIDGCGAPTYHIPIGSIALAFSRLKDPEFLAEQRLCDAVTRLENAIRSHPRAFSGEGRVPFRLAPILDGLFLAKEGAEGLFAMWGESGALVIKSLDGHERGYRWALPALLEHLDAIDEDVHRRWLELDPPVVRNVSGARVGRIVVNVHTFQNTPKHSHPSRPK